MAVFFTKNSPDPNANNHIFKQDKKSILLINSISF